MSKLDEIINKIYTVGEDHFWELDPHEAKQQIKALALELIEETDPSKGSGSKVYWGNVLRQKVSEL